MTVQLNTHLSESQQFGSFLLAEGGITQTQYQVATTLQLKRPFLHLGEVIVMMGLMSEAELETTMARFHREAPARRSALGSDLFDKLDPASDLDEHAQPLEAAGTPRIRLGGREVVMLAGDSVLGLSHDADVSEAGAAATRRHGAGNGVEPQLAGTTELQVAFERDLAGFMGSEACALFATRFQANLGAIAGLVGRNDVVLVDAHAHPSLHDGARLSHGEVRRFDHNDMAHLSELLIGAGERGKLVVIEGVYGAEGDMADLPAIVKLCKAHGARLLLDDAHGFGVLGMRGRGTAEYFRLLDEVDLITLSFSHALGTLGGCVLGDRRVVAYLERRSRPYLYAATLPPGTVAATHAALRRLATDPSLRHRLSRNVEFLRQGLLDLGLTLGPSQSQILTVPVGDPALALRLGQGLVQEGVLVGTVVHPGPPPGQARLRLGAMASHTLEDLGFAIEAFRRVGTRLGLLEEDTPVVMPARPVQEEAACSK